MTRMQGLRHTGIIGWFAHNFLVFVLRGHVAVPTFIGVEPLKIGTGSAPAMASKVQPSLIFALPVVLLIARTYTDAGARTSLAREKHNRNVSDIHTITPELAFSAESHKSTTCRLLCSSVVVVKV